MTFRPFTRVLALVLAMCLTSTIARSEIFVTLHSFTNLSDGNPNGALLPVNGLLYGTTNGTLYSIDPWTGIYTLEYTFSPDAPGDGLELNGGLVLLEGLIYGTTYSGGKYGHGTLFSFDPLTRVEHVLHDFGSTRRVASQPRAGLTAVDGVLFGTTLVGGDAQRGTVFRFDPRSAELSLLYSFQGGKQDGSFPGAPVTAVGAMLYGTAENGGPADTGAVWAIDSRTGAKTILHFFGPPKFSANPRTGVVHLDGKLYGTTRGAPGHCQWLRCGRLYEIDLATGAEVDLHIFDSKALGRLPTGELVLAHGALHGTTDDSVVEGPIPGTAYAFDLATRELTTLHRFRNSDGSGPGSLTLWKGRLWGTKYDGGENRIGGTVFEIKRP